MGPIRPHDTESVPTDFERWFYAKQQHKGMIPLMESDFWKKTYSAFEDSYDLKEDGTV